jgi:DNA-binding SARP family transcriptional activator
MSDPAAAAGDSEAWVDGVRFALLGTLTLADGAGNPRTVPGARQRALLARLLLSANAPVSCDALAEAVWDGSPPPGAATTLRSHVRRLRVALGPQAGARITGLRSGVPDQCRGTCPARKWDSAADLQVFQASGGAHIFVDQAAQDRFSADLPCVDVG